MRRIVRKLGQSHGFLNNSNDGLFLIAFVHSGRGTRRAEELADRSKEGSRWVHTRNGHAECIIARLLTKVAVVEYHEGQCAGCRLPFLMSYIVLACRNAVWAPSVYGKWVRFFLATTSDGGSLGLGTHVPERTESSSSVSVISSGSYPCLPGKPA